MNLKKHIRGRGACPSWSSGRGCAGSDMVCPSARSRKTLIYLILTLNHCYPDYDFSLLRAHHFKKEPGVGAVEEAVDSHLLEVSRVRCPLQLSSLCTTCVS